MSENNQKLPNLEEIKKQLKSSNQNIKEIKATVQKNQDEFFTIFLYSLLALFLIIFLYNNPFNFTSLLGIIKFLQFLAILFIIVCIYKTKTYMQKFKIQGEKIQEIYSERTVLK